jgi:hypothetical protein
VNFILNLLGMTDRVKVANERIAVAAEDIAAIMEQARDVMRERLGYQPAQIEDKSEVVSKKRSK